jgi:hypothetical protein
MTTSDNTEFRNRLVALAEVFDAKIAATRQALYFEALRDLPFERVVYALSQAVRVCKFFPKPAELRALAVGDLEDATEAAWMAFKGAMARAGAYRSLATSNAALGEAIVTVFGSWPAACALELSPEMWTAKRKEFGRVYRVLAGRSLDGARYLAGICEAQNAGEAKWRKHIPVAVLEMDTIRLLDADEAESYRGAIAAERGGLTQVGSQALAFPGRIAEETA